MLLSKIKKFSLLSFSFLLALSVFMGIAVVYAWTEPSQTPPNGNVAAPLNIGASSQYKSGALGVGGAFHGYGTGIFDGNVGIGTASPGAKLDISGTAGTALKISNGGDLVISAQVSGSDTTLYNDTGSLNINTGLAAQGNISATNGYMVGSPTAGAKIQSGYGSGYTSESCDGGSGYHSYTINFPQAFSTIPVVVISARGGGDRSVYVASVQSVSSTRFTFRYSTNDCGRNEGSSGGLYWIAIGQ